MKTKILATAAVVALFSTTIPQTSATNKPLPTVSDAEATHIINTPADEYEKYGKKLGCKFKGTEDLNLLKEVCSWLGTPYKYGANNKGKGTDCSGFVSTVFANVYKIKLNRTSSSMVLNVNKVDRSALECGDILFFANSNGSIYHVAIYLADNVFIHSATSKNIGVKTESLTLGYYNTNYYCAGRVKQLDKRNGEVVEDKTQNTIVNGADKDTKASDAQKSYQDYGQEFGVTFAGNEDLNILGEISQWLGTPYQSGKSAKRIGTDGPGLIIGVFKEACKLSLNRDPEKLMKNLKKTTRNKLKFGDIVIYKKGSSYPIMGIYIGNNKIVYTSVSKGVMVIDMSAVTFGLHFCGSIPALNY